MARLSVNVDHVATVRQARLVQEPDPVTAAALAELAGADGIIVHLREDRRHIQDRDVQLLRQTVRTRLNLEMACAEEIIQFALGVRPDLVTLVPEKRQELTTEGGLDVCDQEKKIGDVVRRLHKAGIRVSLFVDPDPRQIEAAHTVGSSVVEIHTGRYADELSSEGQDAEFQRIEQAVQIASGLGVTVHAGHGLDYRNVERLTHLEEIEEFSVGHSIIARAVLVGMDQAVREMLEKVKG
jgi:pyridoxine 5-phosphate synthase